MKELIPPYYYWIFWWLKNPLKNVTDLSRLVQEIKATLNVSEEGTFPMQLSDAFLFWEIFWEGKKKNGLLKWTDDPERFRRTLSQTVQCWFYKNQPKEYFLKAQLYPTQRLSNHIFLPISSRRNANRQFLHLRVPWQLSHYDNLKVCSNQWDAGLPVKTSKMKGYEIAIVRTSIVNSSKLLWEVKNGKTRWSPDHCCREGFSPQSQRNALKRSSRNKGSWPGKVIEMPFP